MLFGAVVACRFSGRSNCHLPAVAVVTDESGRIPDELLSRGDGRCVGLAVLGVGPEATATGSGPTGAAAKTQLEMGSLNGFIPRWVRTRHGESEVENA